MTKTWEKGAWLEKPYMEHLPMEHVAGEVYAGVFGVREHGKVYKAVHIHSGMSVGLTYKKSDAKKMVEFFVECASVEFWKSIKEQPERSKCSPELIAVMEKCAKFRADLKVIK